MAAPMEVVFSFDTTGSMSQVLDEVKARVNDLVQRLQADIPGFKVGIIAHGDYCDAAEFYDIRVQNLTNVLPDVVNFVNETSGTGGGDIPECYELALRYSRNMSWTPGSRRVLVVIGDAYPHDPNYEFNTLKIDWQDELSALVTNNIRVYGVQYGQDPESTNFFHRLTSASGGQHLRLQDMGDICRIIMAICYAEQGPDIYMNYEAEIRAENDNAALGTGLETALGKLRKAPTLTLSSDSGDVASDKAEKIPHHNSALPLTKKASKIESKDRPRTSSEPAKKQNIVPNGFVHPVAPVAAAAPDEMSNSDTESDSIDLDIDSCIASDLTVQKKSLKRKRAQGEDQIDSNLQTSPSKAAKKTTQSNLKSKRKIYTGKCKQQTSIKKQRREYVSAKQFKSHNLPWSQWHLAATEGYYKYPLGVQGKPNSGDWKTIPQRKRVCEITLWKRDLLTTCVTRMEKELRLPRASRSRTQTPDGGVLFEVGVMSPDSREIKAVWFHALRQRKSGPPSIPSVMHLPWYSGLMREIRSPLVQAASKQSRVYVRWAVLADNFLTSKRNILQQYQYLWRS